MTGVQIHRVKAGSSGSLRVGGVRSALITPADRLIFHSRLAPWRERGYLFYVSLEVGSIHDTHDIYIIYGYLDGRHMAWGMGASLTAAVEDIASKLECPVSEPG